MRDSHYTILSKLHLPLISNLYCSKRVQDPYLKKKLSDYYMSRLIPDFFYHTPLSNNYYPTIIAARVTLSLSFLFLFSYYIYRNNLSSHKDETKKYSFGIFSNSYLRIEKELIMKEKLGQRKIILY